MTTTSEFSCHDTDKRGYCTCERSFDACGCDPADASGSPTACRHCKTPVYHRRTCGDCESHPCRCREGARVAAALLDAALSSRYAVDRLPARASDDGTQVA